MSLKGRVAVVTGAGSGIGRAVALKLGEAGARVVVSDIIEDGALRVVHDIASADGEATFFKADTSKSEDHEALVKAAVERFGGLHIAVNNAGISGPMVPTAEYPLDGWAKVLGVNLSGVFFGMRSQIPALKAAGGGSIVNIASVLGQVGLRNSSAYVAAKHGVVGLTKNAALEYALDNIRVNAVAPGFVKTAMVEKGPPEGIEQLVALHPMGRMATPSEVAELVLWLSSEKASFVTGGYYPIDGGYLAQ